MILEKRKHPRYELYRATEVKNGKSPVYLGVTKDLSRSGVRILTLAPLETGEGVDLRVVFDELQEPTWFSAKVVRSRDVGDSRQLWRREISLSFVDIMPKPFEELFQIES